MQVNLDLEVFLTSKQGGNNHDNIIIITCCHYRDTSMHRYHCVRSLSRKNNLDSLSAQHKDVLAH